MWQTVVVLGILAVVLVYIIRHYVNVFRSDAPTCSGCGGGGCCCQESGSFEGRKNG